MLVDSSLAGLGAEDAVEEAKMYYQEIGENGHSIIQESLQSNSDIDEQLRKEGIIWPQSDYEVLSGDGFFNNLTGEQGVILLKGFQQIARRNLESKQSQTEIKA